MNKKNLVAKGRVYFVFAVFILISLLLISKLYLVQIVEGEFYSQRADRQHIRPTASIFDRGSIFFTTKDGEKINAATLKSGFKVAISPSLIIHPEDVFNNLSLYLAIPEESYLNHAEKIGDPYEEIARRVPYEIGQQIKDLNINGVSVIDENWRSYPGDELAAQTVGFVAYGDDDDIKGRYGLERQYEDILGRDHRNIFTNFFVEIFSEAAEALKDENSMEGSIVTTIEPEVQLFVDNELKTVRETWSPKKAGAIVMDPNDGAIRALSLSPNFDLNQFNLVSDPAIYKNDLIESVYEMGSIIKPLTLSVGLDVGAITPNSTYEDRGYISLNNKTIWNHDKKAHGVVSMQEVLNKSLNTGAGFVEQKMGNEIFADYMKKLFDQKTGVDLPNEAKSILYPNLSSNTDIEYVTASYGQGIAMSPISVIRALAALGNGGKLVTPHLVEQIEYDLGFSKDLDWPEPVSVFKPETSENITRMLVETVDTALRGGQFSLRNYSIAAKTGTAQIPKSYEAGYYDDRFLHSFFGYFPAYDPQFIIFLYQLEPVGGQYAADTLTEPFMNITKFLINYYSIPADRQNSNESIN
ncbi:MAG TPA: penicillin-binding protein 2 [Candidatus Paceibacterota bacterium]|nr:penicillin-binding protein 2 [Candidatus Paceibacterota bacterium]HRZ34490.1 penicillin-binding protein 2 [Candidatus Paceibacterota bacterium]